MAAQKAESSDCWRVDLRVDLLVEMRAGRLEIELESRLGLELDDKLDALS